MSWVRQAPGKQLVYVASFRTGYDTYIADEFKGRVIPSTTGSTANLRIDDLTTADSAIYYCARFTVTQVGLFFAQYIWGSRNFCSVPLSVGNGSVIFIPSLRFFFFFFQLLPTLSVARV